MGGGGGADTVVPNLHVPTRARVGYFCYLRQISFLLKMDPGK